MARDLNRFVRQYKESAVRYNSKLDFICNKYAEQNEKEEEWVVDLSSMDFTRDTNGVADELEERLQRVKSSKECDSGKVSVGKFSNRLVNEEADLWLSGEEEEAEEKPRSVNQYKILKDMSTCMEQFYDSQQCEPSDGETLSSSSSDSDINLYSDYSCSSSTDGESEMSDDEKYVDQNFERPENGNKKVDKSGVSKIEKKAGKYKDDYSHGLPRHGIEHRSSIKGDFPKGRQESDWRENVMKEGRSHKHSPKSNMKKQHIRYRGLDLFESEDSLCEINRKERNNNTHKANLNVMQEQKFAEQTEFIPKSRTNEKNYVPKIKEPRCRPSDLNHANKSPGNGQYGDNQQNKLSRSNLRQESRYNDLDVTEESMLSYDSVPVESYGPRRSASERQMQKDKQRHYNKNVAIYDSPKEQKDNIDSETYTVSPKNKPTGINVRNKAGQSNLAAERSPRCASDYQRVRQNSNLKLSVRKKLSTATDYKQFSTGTREQVCMDLIGRSSASSDKNSNRLGLSEQNVLKSPKSSGEDNMQYDSVFDKSSKKDSGICSYIDDTHESEKNLKVLSVKNLEAFNESYSEKWAMDVSMNQSDLVKKTEKDNEEKINQWLSSFNESLLNEQDDSSYLQVSEVDIPGEGLVMNSTPRKVTRESGWSDTPISNRNRSRHTSGYCETVDTACQTVAKSPVYVEADNNSPRQAHRRKISPRLSSPHQTPGKAAEKRLIKRVARSLKDSGDGEPHRKTRDIGKMIRNVYSSPLKYRMIEESLVRSSSLNAGKRMAEDLDYDADTTDDVTGIDFVPTPPKSRRTSFGSKIGDGDGKSRQTGSKNMVSGRQFENVQSDQSHDVQRQAMNGAEFVSVYDESHYQRFDGRDKRLSVSNSTICQPQYGNSYGQRYEIIQESRNMPRTAYDNQVDDSEMFHANRLKHRPHQDLSECAQRHIRGQKNLFEDHEYIRSNEFLSDIPDDLRSSHRNTRTQKSPNHYSESQNVRPNQLTNRNHENRPGDRDLAMYRNHRENLVPEVDKTHSQQTYVRSDRPTISRSFESVKHRPAVDGHDGRYQDDRNASNSCTPKVQKDRVQNNTVPDQAGHPYSQSRNHYENDSESYNNAHSRTGYHAFGEKNVRGVGNAQELDRLTNRNDSDTTRYRSQRQNIHDSQSIQSPVVRLNRQNERLPRSRESEIDRENHQPINSEYYSPINKYRSPRHQYLNEISDLEEIQTYHDSFRDSYSKISPRQTTHESERTVQNFDSPSSKRERMRHVNNEFFSPSGSLAKLRLHTPKSKTINLSDECVLDRHSEVKNVRESMCTEDSEDIYDDFRDCEIPASSRDMSQRNQFQRQTSDRSYQKEMYVENLSDKENDCIDRAGFISLDRISTASGPVTVQRYRNSDRVESPGLSGRNKQYGNTAVHRRSVSNSDRYSPAIDRKQTSPRTAEMVFSQGGLKNTRHQRNAQSPSIKNNCQSSSYSRDGASEAHEGNAFQRRMINTSSRTNGDTLVSAKQAVNRDCNVAQVRKMDVVKKVQAKPKMKKNLFTGTRNVATPVSFNDFAEGISCPGECEMVDGKISRRPPARHTEEFKVPFSVNLQQHDAETNLYKQKIQSRKQFKPQASYRDVMSSTAVDNSRLMSVKLQHRGTNFVHSTPMSGRVPVLLNETISTIQAPEETVHEEDVVLIT